MCIHSFVNTKDSSLVIRAGDNTFLWTSRNCRRMGLSFMVLQYVGPLALSDRFRYSVTLRTADKIQALTEWENTQSYLKVPYEAMKQEKCPQFFNSYIDLCLDSTNTLEVEVNARYLRLQEKPDIHVEPSTAGASSSK